MRGHIRAARMNWGGSISAWGGMLSKRALQLTLFIVSLAAPAMAAAQGTKLVSKFNDWTYYAHESPQAKVCFAIAAPKSSEPAGAKRDSIYFYISAWPKDGVRSEVSIKLGYPLKKGADATITVGSTAFKLFTRDERAYLSEAGDETKLIDALKKASSMTVQGISERGTVTKDTYSLTGLPQALQTLASSCN